MKGPKGGSEKTDILRNISHMKMSGSIPTQLFMLSLESLYITWLAFNSNSEA
jgi:hypothetical protein